MDNREVKFDCEEDGRWIAEIKSVPGALVYGSTSVEAESRVRALVAEVELEAKA